MDMSAENIKAVIREYEEKLEVQKRLFLRKIEENQFIIENLRTENDALKQLVTELKAQLARKD